MKNLALLLIVLIILAGGWYFFAPQLGKSFGSNTAEQGQTPETPVAPTTAVDQVKKIIGDNIALGTDGNDVLGTYLIGFNGFPVYTFDNDTGSESKCYEECARNWPPYLVSPVNNINQLKSGVKGAVATTSRSDGTWQLTYNGKPLYFYAPDTSGSTAQGDGVSGVWHVVKP